MARTQARPFDPARICADLDGAMICAGELTLPHHPRAVLPRHRAVVYKDGIVHLAEAKRHPRLGFFTVAEPLAYVSMPRPFACAIEDNARFSAKAAMTFRGEAGSIGVKSSALPIAQGLTDWRLAISPAAGHGCRIRMSAALHTEKPDPIAGAPLNYWPKDGERPRRLAIRFVIPPLIRIACFGASIATIGPPETFALPQNFSPHRLTHAALLPSGAIAVFSDGKVLRANIMDDTLAWQSPAFSNVRGTVFIKGCGKKLIDSVLARSPSFEIVLKGRAAISVGGSRECGEDGFKAPSYDRALISGELDEFGLALQVNLRAEQDGAELIERFAVPWSTLILRRFNVMRHRPAFLGV
jgi:hypothetical protein